MPANGVPTLTRCQYHFELIIKELNSIFSYPNAPDERSLNVAIRLPHKRGQV
jgi:hypothetical protein